jgi:hypothetical protein
MTFATASGWTGCASSPAGNVARLAAVSMAQHAVNIPSYQHRIPARDGTTDRMDAVAAARRRPPEASERLCSRHHVRPRLRDERPMEERAPAV